MEEASNIQLITIFLSSHILQQVKIDLYQTDDTSLQYLNIKNYSSKTIKISKFIQNFYCTVTNSPHAIQEQFQCNFKELLKEDQKPTLQIEFDSFKLSVTVQFTKQLKEFYDPQKIDDYFSSLAMCNLKRLQKRILKKIEVEQLKKPIKPKCKFAVKKSDVPKTKTNVCFVVDKQRLSSQKKLVRRNSKKLQTVHDTQVKLPQTENNQNSQDHSVEQIKNKRTCGKHKTMAYKPEKMFEESVKQISVKEKKAEDLPMYELILQLFNKSLVQNKKIVKHHRTRILRNSYNNLLQAATQRDLKIQNQVLNVIQSSTDYTWFTMNNSKVVKTGVKGLKTSPYKVNSINFRKRKVY